ncbi:unnamed protein product, partial [Anisakis simplex]|uniref:CBS domain-containing protein n=1 Tax=Anisakis simplex TaxID=6269 RepID=A0A0M3JAJ0_ANISI
MNNHNNREKKINHFQMNFHDLNYARLLQYNACYDAMPASSKMVVFDVNLQLRKAFNGLIYQNTRHVLLSDPESDGSVVGILSVTDFIRPLAIISINVHICQCVFVESLKYKTNQPSIFNFRSIIHHCNFLCNLNE